MQYDFGFGEAKAVREVLGNFYSPHMGEHHEILSIRDMGYPGTGPGLPELIEHTKRLILTETGLQYKNIIITAGASNAINSILRVMNRNFGYSGVHFRKPYFSHYPKFVKKADMEIVDTPTGSAKETIDLIDSPSNPEGNIRSNDGILSDCVVWDATYYNSVYNKFFNVHPQHDICVGSFGKLFGINGVRLGWIATNNDHLAFHFTKEVYEETLGVSVTSQRLVLNIFDNIILEKFTEEAAMQIDCNREEMAKLEYLSDNAFLVPINGMFYWAKMNQKAQNLLKTCGVHWISGDACGADESYVRLNLAQDRILTRNMIKAVLKADRK